MTTGIARTLHQDKHCLQSICSTYTAYFRKQASNLDIAYSMKVSGSPRCLPPLVTPTISTRLTCNSSKRYYRECMVHAVAWKESYAHSVSSAMIFPSIQEQVYTTQ